MPATLNPLCWADLADFKEHLDIDATDTSRDNFLTRQLNVAYNMCVNYIGHDLNVTTYTEDYDGDGDRTILLANFPVITIIALYDDLYRTWQMPPSFTPDGSTLLDPSNYFVVNATGVITAFQGINSFRAGHGNIHAIYSAGYASVPDDATNAVILLAARNANRAGTEGLMATSLGGFSKHFDPAIIPADIRQMLIGYKKFAV